MPQAKKYPNVGVKIFFLCRGKIMTFRHKDGMYDLPGGTMEWGESVMETLRRELKEELDYDLKKEPELFGVYNDFFREKGRHRVQLQYILKMGRMPEFISLEGVEYFWLDKKASKKIFDNKILNIIFNY